MANIKSQIKRNRQNEKARERNKAVRSQIKTTVKAADAAIGTDDEQAALTAAIRRLDMAAQSGAIHKNAAARKKSRLTKRVNAGVTSDD